VNNNIKNNTFKRINESIFRVISNVNKAHFKNPEVSKTRLSASILLLKEQYKVKYF